MENLGLMDLARFYSKDKFDSLTIHAMLMTSLHL